MRFLAYIIVILAAYLLGAIPTGYLAGRLVGIDVRQYGSGRTGTTNVMRSAGTWPAFLTLLGDALKGIAAVALARAVLGVPMGEVLAGLAAILGHNRSVFIGWHGGAGVITATAILLYISPVSVMVIAPIAFIVLLASRIASLASLTLCVLMPWPLVGLSILAQQPREYILYGLIASAFIIYAHRPNIRRLLAGTERRIGEKGERRR